MSSEETRSLPFPRFL